MIDSDFIRSNTSYDPETGLFTKIFRNRTRVTPGTTDSDGYLVLSFTRDGKKKQFKAHRLAWFLHYGKWPDREIDHRDGNRKNNSIANLREASVAQNRQNRPRIANRVGLKGVYQSGGRFYAVAQVNKVVHRLGRFATAEAAHKAYLQAVAKLHREFSAIRRSENF